ncbi:MAG: hypothetical protein R2939_20980, partial [Kofleriaceae bacterium]
LALEAKLLVGAFTAAAATHATGSVTVGVIGGAVGGVAVALVQAALVLGARAEQVVVGVVLNLLALSGTRFLLQAIYGEGANSPPVASVGDRLVDNPVAWVALAAALVVPWWLARTRRGLHARAAGDRPAALRAVGVSVPGVRLRVLVLGGALAGVGGAQLSLSVGVFAAEMSAGRGYLALAAVILSGWRPVRAALIALAIAAAEAIRIQLQVRGDTLVPRELAQVLPYLVTLVVLAGFGGGRRPPAALGRADDGA